MDEVEGLEMETVSEPAPSSWLVVYNKDTVPRVKAIVASQDDAYVWLADNRPDWQDHGDITAIPYGSQDRTDASSIDQPPEGKTT